MHCIHYRSADPLHDTTAQWPVSRLQTSSFPDCRCPGQRSDTIGTFYDQSGTSHAWLYRCWKYDRVVPLCMARTALTRLHLCPCARRDLLPTRARRMHIMGQRRILRPFEGRYGHLSRVFGVLGQYLCRKGMEKLKRRGLPSISGMRYSFSQRALFVHSQKSRLYF